MEIKLPKSLAVFRLLFDQLESPEIEPSEEIALVAYLISAVLTF